MVTSKSDGCAKVWWSAPKSDGMLLMWTLMSDGYAKSNGQDASSQSTMIDYAKVHQSAFICSLR